MDFNITLQPLEELSELQTQWVDLQRRAMPSFFLTWDWIGCWLRRLSTRPLILRATGAGQIIALAVLFPSARRSEGRFPAKCLYLTETGNPAEDRLTIEYNGILADQTSAPGIVQACVDFLLSSSAPATWDELYLGGVAPDYADYFRGYRNVKLIPRVRKSVSVDLEAIRSTGKSYLESLSSNSRYQIRRSARYYQQFGEIGIVTAEDEDVADAFLPELKRLHIEYWSSRDTKSGFSETFFTDFHEELIVQGLKDKRVDLLRVAAGSLTIGYLYNFVHNGKVYFYLSAFNYPDDPKVKPGLLSHALAIQHYLDAGQTTYDFMAGDARYKDSLSNAKSELYWLIVRRRRMKFVIEDLLRFAKHSLLSRRKTSGLLHTGSNPREALEKAARL